jgi:hypothetical protein
MKRLRQLLEGPAEDRGTALILVLFIVTVIGLAGAALLTFSDTSIRTTLALRDQAGNAYNADGAAQVAINSLSTGKGFAPALFKNATGTTCYGTSGTLDLRNFYPGTGGLNGTAPSSASVTCLADPETGINGTVVPITGANRPGQAIMTLGQTSEVGINVEAPSTSPFSVKGPVTSNSTINVAPGATLQSTAAVTAHTGCLGSGIIVSNPTKVCNAPITPDPGYASEAATVVPTYQDVPACSIGVVTFYAGYYDDANALTTLMDSTGPCAGRTWWFTPGTYYFDFHNNTDDSDVYRGSGTGSGRTANRWAITSGNLVAGTPVDSNGTVIGSPGGSPTIPGSCQNPIKSTTAAGVQFIFGGDSQLALGGSAKAEICGTYSDTKPPIALYGVKLGAATTTTLFGPGSALKLSAVPASQPPFVNPTNIIADDNSSATWVKGNASLESSTVTGSGYAPPSAIPAGSIVKSAVIRVKHGNSSGYVTTGGNKDSLTLTFTPTGGTAIPLTPTLNPGLGLVTDSIDIFGGGTSDFVKFVHKNGFTGASMAYKATLKHQGTESLDAMQIDISYVAPAFRAENISTISPSCMNQTYTRSSGSACAVLSTSISTMPFTGAFYIQGTTYTPLAAIDLTLSNATQQVLRFGIISRSLWVKTASFSYTGPLIEIPDDTTGDNGAPIVFLTVYVCPARTTSSCSTDAGAVTALRVKARIDDVTPPSKMTILSWSNLR